MSNLYRAAAGLDRLDQLALGSSPVHRLHPMAKLVTTIIYIVAVVSFPPDNISGLMPFIFYPAVMIPLSGTPCLPLLTRLLITLPFPMTAGISGLVFFREVAFYIGDFSVSLGLVFLCSCLLKTLLTVSAVLILAATTPFGEIGRQLSFLGVPEIICLQLAMTYRYLSVLINEAVLMFTAYRLRAPEQKGIKMRDMGSFLGQLILRALARAEEIYQAMKCRGFNGVYLTGNRRRMCRRDLLYAVVVTVFIVTLRLFNLSMFWGKLVLIL